MRTSRRDRQGAQPRRGALRRLTAGREPLPRTDSERIAAVAAEADVPVEDVLREVADFRLALETDMIIAAAAADADTPDLLSEVLDGERLELATFHDRLLERLADAAAEDELALRRARRRPVGGVSRWVAAAAAAAAVFGVGRALVAPTDLRDTAPVAAMETADQHYARFSSAVTSDSPVAVQQAARDLHRTLQKLIDEHANDPEVAQRAAQLLQAEINLLRATSPDGASQVLADARHLVRMLERAAPPRVRDAVQPVLDAAVAPSEKPKSKAKPKPTASPSPKATPSSPRPSSSAPPSGSQSPGPNPLDTP